MKMMKFRTLIVVILALAALSACKSQYEQLLQSNDVDQKYQGAFKLFDNKKYAKAAELFESLSLATRGTAQDDTVQFYWALSNYKYGDYITAESNFDTFINTFPLSPFNEYARFLRIDCLYRGTYRYELDQKPTYKALTIINEFLLEKPQSEYVEQVKQMKDDLNDRLELKAYKSAYLYYHMEDYLAAHYALKNVLKENADNRYREEILYYTAVSAYKYADMSIPAKQRERFMTFVDDYYNMVSEFPENSNRKTLDNMYEKAHKFLKKNGGATTDK